MNLHEYQGKDILADFGVGIQRGIVANNIDEAVDAAKKLTADTGTSWHIVKAQIHAGGRGKGGGVKLAKNLTELKTIANQIIGMQLITPQTPPEGKKVNKVLVAEDVYYPGDSKPKEFYISVLLNRETGRNMIMYSTEGGMDIEKVAENTPELIFTEEIDPAFGLQSFQARNVAFNLGLSGVAFKGMVKFITTLYNAYLGSDASLFEINPVLKTSDDKIIAVDAKVTLDENALFRHKEYVELRDLSGNRTLVVFDSGDEVAVQAGENGVRFLLISGTPIKEPVAWHGPIVMNSQEELRQAFKELNNGTFIK